MARRIGKKVEALLSDEELALMQKHMHRAHFTSVASYVRAAVLAGLPAMQYELEIKLGELASSTNRMNALLEKNDQPEVRRHLPLQKRLIKSVQTWMRSHLDSKS